MAPRALGAARPFEKLSAVIVLMTVHAFCERYRRLEISVQMAIFACHCFVLSDEWVFRFRVVKSLQSCDLLPARGGMTRLAGLAETSLMRIGMTRRALCERESRVLDERLRTRLRRMAFRAGNLFVRAGQRVFRHRVSKESRRLPSVGGVATRAVFTHLSAMLVRVAAYTVVRKPQIRAVKVLDEDARARRG